MKTRLLLLLCLAPALLLAQAATRSAQKTQVDSLLPTNGAGSITAAQLRTVIKAAIDSAYNPLDDGTAVVTGGSYANPAWITNLAPTKLTQSGATTNQVLKWNGSSWAPADDATGGGAGTFAALTGVPGDNAALASALSAKETPAGAQAKADAAQAAAISAAATDATTKANAAQAAATSAAATDATTKANAAQSAAISAAATDATTKANAAQAAAVQRSNHTGTQPLSTISQSGATLNQVAKWNGSAWAPADDATGGVSVSRQTFSNAAVTVSVGTTVLAQTGTLSASRVVTLPAASAYAAGTGFDLVDESGTVTPTNSLVLTRAGSDTVNGGTTYAVITGYASRRLTSDGATKWTIGRINPDELGTITYNGSAVSQVISERTIPAGGSAGNERSVVFRVGGVDLLTLYAEDNGSGGPQNYEVRPLGLNTSGGGRRVALREFIGTTLAVSDVDEWITGNNASTSTYNLPALGGTTYKRTYRFKNVGAGNMVIDPAGSETIFDTSSVSTITLTTGQSAVLVGGSGNWIRF